ncbi:hypothetical protein ANCDUO_20663 [Ancylostoma duodenale]|uniref:Uncharacterized protein n=1 Tax=Ancylostoma duodenale TaxID=51022 RepID=A0A0C2FRG5_9BILA|nr:hypothetical protein ANCDUO_20663 [Ancylostoma duodenale]
MWAATQTRSTIELNGVRRSEKRTPPTNGTNAKGEEVFMRPPVLMHDSDSVSVRFLPQQMCFELPFLVPVCGGWSTHSPLSQPHHTPLTHYRLPEVCGPTADYCPTSWPPRSNSTTTDNRHDERSITRDDCTPIGTGPRNGENQMRYSWCDGSTNTRPRKLHPTFRYDSVPFWKCDCSPRCSFPGSQIICASHL